MRKWATSTDGRLAGENRRRRMLHFIHDINEMTGYGPTYREILAEVGPASTGAVSWHMSVLKRHGLVEGGTGRVRDLRLTDKGRNVINVVTEDPAQIVARIIREGKKVGRPAESILDTVELFVRGRKR